MSVTNWLVSNEIKQTHFVVMHCEMSILLQFIFDVKFCLLRNGGTDVDQAFQTSASDVGRGGCDSSMIKANFTF